MKKHILPILSVFLTFAVVIGFALLVQNDANKRKAAWLEIRQHNCINLNHEQIMDLAKTDDPVDAAWLLGQWHDHAAQEQAMLANSPLNTDETRAEHIREHEAFQAAYQWYDNYWNKK